MNEPFLVYAIGFIAQFFFSARTIIQWFKSEKEKAVVSPSLYWIFSVMGSYLLFIYGWCRGDFSIILGQLLSYYIYLWNLNLKSLWSRISIIFKIVLIITPVIAVSVLLKDINLFIDEFFRNEEVPFGMLLFGSAGQIIFTLRFVYQWAYSVRKKESSLPQGFWIISLIGSGTIVAYGIFRNDPVLILGQSFGFIAYCRNLIIGYKSSKQNKS